jgi:hypothetical protein
LKNENLHRAARDLRLQLAAPEVFVALMCLLPSLCVALPSVDLS